MNNNNNNNNNKPGFLRNPNKSSTPFKHNTNNFNYYNNNNNINNRQQNGFNNNTMSNLNKLGVHTYSSSDVENKVISKIDREMKENEIKDLEKKVQAYDKEILSLQKFIEGNDDNDLNELLEEEQNRLNNENLDSSNSSSSRDTSTKDVLNSLKVIIALKKKKLSETTKERDAIVALITNIKEELRVSRENRQNFLNSLKGKPANGSLSSQTSTSKPSQSSPSFLDMALGFGGNSQPQETERERLIRTGKITPFADLPKPRQAILLDSVAANKPPTPTAKTTTTTTSRSNDVKKGNRFDQKFKVIKKKLTVREKKRQLKMTQYTRPRVLKPRKVSFYDDLEDHDDQIDLSQNNDEPEQQQEENDDDEPIEIESDKEIQKTINVAEDEEMEDDSGDDYISEEDEEEEEEKSDQEMTDKNKKRKRVSIDVHKENWTDDGDERVYLRRFMAWRRKFLLLKNKKQSLNKELSELDKISREINKDTQSDEIDEDELDDEKLKEQNALIEDSNSNNNIDETSNSNDDEDVDINDEIGDDLELSGGLKIPFEIYSKLFEYQVTGVKWLWELHQQEAGGIVGDEMGLGKTIQIVSFLASLHYSKMLGGPALIVAPATLLSNWVKEFHKWWPAFRVGLYHSSGNNRNEIVDVISDRGHILLTTYESIRINQDILLDHHWEYIVLDEGHKIKNPDAEITLSCKQFQTCHRLILSGSPIQNKLTELWSLFDFVFPGKLGTLPIFQSQFSTPIGQGAYSNSSILQVQTAYKCAVALRDLISPYMLRRVKSDVLKSLPSKNEQVLMCPLTESQEKLYLEFLESNDVQSVLEGKRNLLYGIDVLKKICNHPDILHINPDDEDHPEDYGNMERSAKLKVVQQILPMWKKQNDKVLLFCQTRQMLDIIEDFIRKETKFQYRRMDGTTSVKNRQTLVEEFNLDPDIFIFLLTTKVGGLGLNLTGANRVILFDPDWNPSTDAQARERVYRIGQKKMVTIYRLVTLGTIEEKIYHRQIYKQFLTNKILKDPRQKRFFKTRHFKDLFSYTKQNNKASSETGDYFHESKSEILPEHLNSENEDDDDDGDDNPSKRKKLKRTHQKNGNGKDSLLDEKHEEDDSFILKKLFEKEGLKSALKHDTIMEQAGTENVQVEKEAEKIAERAVSTLKKSREFIEKQNQGTLTWTGKYGYSGVPSIVNSSNENTSTPTPSKGRFGNKSKMGSSVQTGIGTQSMIPIGVDTPNNVMQNKSTTSNEASSSNILSQLTNEEEELAKSMFGVNPNEIIELIFNFFISKGGSVTTQAIVNNFKLDLSEEQTPLFRSLLKSIAEFNKPTKRWHLKTEFLLK
ncbi:SNF2-related domain-containing protein [Tieghemostelium lacteum]|uniref:SNF2-related domain-containing protein n=1 Tax=Tieghemostelium lacteum TaxID=361077 RepID=A0A151Z9J7_TIELA|nr:SNF2-related domain-containing protein [Tieghemostelium lacteum]|eukprot:KYQ90628.1 SNF2-related domain-containing protein [Tieghemostelium lacteum]